MVPQPDVLITIASRPPSRGPGVDIGARLRKRLIVAAHVMDERTAAARASRHHHLDAVAREHADCGCIDVRRQHVVDAAGQKRDAAFSHAGRGKRLWGERAMRAAPRRKAEHRGEPLQSDEVGERRERFCQPRRVERMPKAPRIGQQPGKHIAQQALARRAAVRLLDMDAGMIDQMHVMHA